MNINQFILFPFYLWSKILEQLEIQIRSKLGDDRFSYIMNILADLTYFISIVLCEIMIEYQNPNFEVNYYLRNLSISFFTSLVISANSENQKSNFLVQQIDLRPITIRTVFVTFQQVCFFLCINYIELSVAYVITYTTPLFILLFELCIEQQSITRKEMIGIFIAFAGTTLLVYSQKNRKQQGNHNQRQEQDGEINSLNKASSIFYCCLLLFSTVIYSIGIMAAQQIQKTAPTTVGFYHSICYTATGATIFMLKGTDLSHFTPLFLLQFFFQVGIFFYIQQICFLKATTICQNHAQLTATSYICLLYPMIFEYYYQNHLPSPLSCVSMVTIIYGLCYVSQILK